MPGPGDMTKTNYHRRWRIGLWVGGLLVIIMAAVFHEPLWQAVTRLAEFISDREKIQSFISRSGALAPVVFVAIQFLQVVLAPIPGEATGVIGGFLFGTFTGFILSSMALALGSMGNFLIGRFLGRRYVRKIIPVDKLKRFDTLIKRQGVLVLFLLFLFPGFPKDYLCFFLGMTALPFKVFFIIASLGRMPGTLFLSLQGASLYEGNYLTVAVLAGVCPVLAWGIYRFREQIYAYVEKMNHR